MRLEIFAKAFPGTDRDEVLRQAAAVGTACVQLDITYAGLPPMVSANPQSTVAEVSIWSLLTRGLEEKTGDSVGLPHNTVFDPVVVCITIGCGM